MMVLNKNEFWSILNKVTGIVANAMILMIIARFLPTKDVAIYFLFTAIFGVIGIVEGGFMQTISRHITYILNKKDTHVNLDPNFFIHVNNRLFKIIVTLITTATLIGGTTYLYFHDTIKLSFYDYLAWIIFITNSVIMLFANLHSSIIIGFQNVAATQKYQLLSALFNLLSVSVFLFLLDQNSLLGFVSGNFFARCLLLFLNYKKSRTYYTSTKQNYTDETFARNLVLSDMKKMLLNMLSYRLLTSVFYIILTGYVSVELLASFGLTVQIVTYIIGVTTIFLSSNIPYFASLFSKNEITILNKIFLKKSVVSLLFYILGILSFIIAFDKIQVVFNLRTSILPNIYIASFLVFTTIEYTISLIAIYLIVCNELRLMSISLISSIIILIATLISLSSSGDLNLTFYARAIIALIFLYIPAIYFIKQIQKNHTFSGLSFSSKALLNLDKE
jgi:hypothetical protein